MDIRAFKDLLEMTTNDWESKLDEVLHENFESEAKELLIEELVNDVGVEREIIEAVLDNNCIDYN